MALQHINPTDISPPRGFTHVVKAGNTIYVAGQVGRRNDGTLAGMDVESQTDQVFQNLKAALASVGSRIPGHGQNHRLFDPQGRHSRFQDRAG